MSRSAWRSGHGRRARGLRHGRHVDASGNLALLAPPRRRRRKKLSGRRTRTSDRIDRHPERGGLDDAHVRRPQMLVRRSAHAAPTPPHHVVSRHPSRYRGQRGTVEQAQRGATNDPQVVIDSCPCRSSRRSRRLGERGPTPSRRRRPSSSASPRRTTNSSWNRRRSSVECNELKHGAHD